MGTSSRAVSCVVSVMCVQSKFFVDDFDVSCSFPIGFVSLSLGSALFQFMGDLDPSISVSSSLFIQFTLPLSCAQCHLVETLAFRVDSVFRGNLIVWSSPPASDPSDLSDSSSFTSGGGVKALYLSHVLLRISVPSGYNVVVSVVAELGSSSVFSGTSVPFYTVAALWYYGSEDFFVPLCAILSSSAAEVLSVVYSCRVVRICCVGGVVPRGHSWLLLGIHGPLLTWVRLPVVIVGVVLVSGGPVLCAGYRVFVSGFRVSDRGLF